MDIYRAPNITLTKNSNVGPNTLHCCFLTLNSLTLVFKLDAIYFQLVTLTREAAITKYRQNMIIMKNNVICT